MRMFMSLLTGVVVFAGTGGALTVGVAALVLTPALADSPDSFLAKYLVPVYIVSICLSVFLTYLSASGMFKNYYRRMVGSVTIGNLLPVLLALPLTIAGFFYVQSEVDSAAIAFSICVIPLAAILSVFGIVVRFIRPDVTG